MRYVLLIAALMFPVAGFACSCIWPEEIKARHILDAICESDAVFVGDVETELAVRDYVFEYKIWPRESFAGQLSSPTFAISETGGKCGYRFTEGGRYLIFGDRREDTNYLDVSSCGLTTLFDSDDFIYRVLAENKELIDKACSTEAVEARRMERLREKDEKREALEEATRELLQEE